MMRNIQFKNRQKIFGEQTSESLETYLKHRFNEVRSDSPICQILNPFIMRTSNGQNENDTANVSNENLLTPTLAETELLSFIRFHGIDDYIKSLKMTHDIALYHSDLSLEEKEKFALYLLKSLWERLERMNAA